MSKLADLKKKAADLEQRRMFDRALAVYEEVLQAQEGAEDADVGLFNRVGDLHLRQGNVEAALGLYEQAVNLYVERGFHNNAVALCNKILRQDPHRAEMHFRLGQINCGKGFRAEARRHFQEFVAQLNRTGAMDRAVGQLREFADENGDLDDVRLMLAEILLTHGRVPEAVSQLRHLRDLYEMEGRRDEAQGVLDRILELDPDFQVGAEGPGDPEDGAHVHRPSASHRQSTVPDLVLFDPSGLTPPARSAPTPPRALTAAEQLEQEPAAGSSSWADQTVDIDLLPASEPADAPGGHVPLTAAEFLGDGLLAGPGSTVDLPEGLIQGVELDSPDATLADAPFLDLEPTAFEVEPAVAAEAPEGLEGGPFSTDLAYLDDPGSMSTAEPLGFSVVWNAGDGATDADAPGDEGIVDTELGLESPFGMEDEAGEGGDALEFFIPDTVEPAVPAPDTLGSAESAGLGLSPLFELDQGSALPDSTPLAADIALAEADGADQPGEAASLASPAGEPDGLILPGDDWRATATPLHFELPEPAQSAAQEPEAVGGAPSAPAEPADRDEPPAPGAAVSATGLVDVPATPAAGLGPEEPGPGEDATSFVNLGDWLREDDEPRSTRMVTEEKAPTGDEQADFAEMLRKFKQGVAENVDDGDHASHYDLGVAFREMGLVDEAIAAFQRALRGAEQRVRTFEALGRCFIDKEQYAVAASVLQRALQEPGADDERLVGVLYLLGRAAEGQNLRTDALRYYQRVFAVDIEFGDVIERIGAVERVPQ